MGRAGEALPRFWEEAIRDILFAVGLVLALEGLICAAFPKMMRKVMLEASQMPEHPMRIIGVISAALGVLLLWLIKAL